MIDTSDCICPGQNVTYECTVVGGLFTIWSGSVIETGCQIVLPHSNPGTYNTLCNNRAVVSRGVEVNNNCFTSQLTVLLTLDLYQRTVQCIVDDGLSLVVIGTVQLLTMITGIIQYYNAIIMHTVLYHQTISYSVPFPPPTDVHLISASPEELVFSWTPPSQNCSSLSYTIITDNCGDCPIYTNNIIITCRNFALSSVCTLAVSTITCGDLTFGDLSNPAITNLTGIIMSIHNHIAGFINSHSTKSHAVGKQSSLFQ